MPNVYNPDTEVGARLLVGNTRIPIVDEGVVTDVRKQGPLAINRATNVRYPANGLGYNWNTLIGVSDPRNEDGDDIPSAGSLTGVTEDSVQSVQAAMMDDVVATPVDVQYRHEGVDGWLTAHRGYVKGVGGGGEPNKMRLQIGSISDFLSVIPASKKFGGTAELSDVLSYLLDALEDGQPVFDDVELATAGNIEESSVLINRRDVSIEAFLYALGEGVWNLVTGKTFTPNRNSLADVVNWMQYHANVRLWFEPKADGGLAFVVAPDPPQSTFTQTAIGGDVDVVHNNALWQMQPVNTLTATGQVGGRVENSDLMYTGVERNEGEASYPQATVQYTPLVERAGGVVKASIDTNTSYLETTTNAVRRHLKNRLDEAGGGMIGTELEPLLLPYSELRAKPTINDDTFASPPTISYEIESVKHVASVDDVPHSKLRVSMFVDTDEIDVVESDTGRIPV